MLKYKALFARLALPTGMAEIIDFKGLKRPTLPKRPVDIVRKSFGLTNLFALRSISTGAA